MTRIGRIIWNCLNNQLCSCIFCTWIRVQQLTYWLFQEDSLRPTDKSSEIINCKHDGHITGFTAHPTLSSWCCWSRSVAVTVLLSHCHGVAQPTSWCCLYSSWCCSAVVMVLLSHCHGVAQSLSWCCSVTVMVLLRHWSCPLRHCHGVAQPSSWHHSGIVMVLLIIIVIASRSWLHMHKWW
jgi:hypothetical protein